MTEPGEKPDKESFTARWARRKQAVKQGQRKNDGEMPPAAEKNRERSQQDAQWEEQALMEEARAERLAILNNLTDEDMPEIEALTPESDYSVFMSVNVSEDLRKSALRKLFHSENFNIRDNLNEYDGDYTEFVKLDAGTLTADIRHRLALEAERLGEGSESNKKPLPVAQSVPDSEQTGGTVAKDITTKSENDRKAEHPSREDSGESQIASLDDKTESDTNK